MGIDDFSLCGNKGWLGGRKPSKEHGFHQKIYEERPEVNAILHASPFYSTLLANSNEDIPSNYFVESMYYLEKIERVPYKHLGSQPLAMAVKEKAKKTNIIILENHGVIVYDTNIKDMQQKCMLMLYSQVLS